MTSFKNVKVVEGGQTDEFPEKSIERDREKSNNEFSNESIDTIRQEELESAKARIKSDNVFKFDSVFYQAMQVGMLETKNISWRNLDSYYKISETITLSEVMSAGKSYITENKHLITVLRPMK